VVNKPKDNMETKQEAKLFLQLWIFPLKNGLLAQLKPEQWQTLSALATFMNKNGECFPSLRTLAHMLGLKDQGAVSARIKNLEGHTYENEPILIVRRGKRLSEKGTYLFTNNTYFLNPEIFSIFY
jgi:DNA-binding MarR family transcriptional regulator